MKNLNIQIIALLCLSLFAISCEKDEPVIPNEEEVITTLSYTLTPQGGGEEIVFLFQDLDGDGGTAPTFQVDDLQANTVYNGRLELLNEQDSPAENITTEVLEEDEEHQFFFQSSFSDLTVTYEDQDSNGNPLGIQTSLTTNSSGNGSLTITLRHEPNKAAAGVSDGNIMNAGGETDIEVTFSFSVL